MTETLTGPKPTNGLGPTNLSSNTKVNGMDIAYLFLYVDDIVLTTSSEMLLQRIIASLHQEFSMTDLRSLNYFLGISVTRDSFEIFLSQRKYATEILERAHMVNCNTCRIPVDTESKVEDDVQRVCLYMHDSREPHFSALKWILRYLRGTLDHRLQLFSSSTTSLVAYSNGDWAGFPTTRAEAEYHSVANAIVETCWLRNLLRELHIHLSFATLVDCDNVSAVNLSSNPVQHQEVESTLFSIKLHYAGVFTKSPNRKYINGNITFVDMIDSDEFSVHEIDSMLEDLGQDGHRVMFYHFLKPGCDLDNGLEPIACDRDVVVLGNYVTQGLKLVEVFVEHEKTNPDIYTPPKAKRLVIEELDAEPIISKAGITPVARKLVLDVNNNQTCGKEKGKSSGKDLEGQSSAVGNDGSYEESQDPNFDPFADLDLILPTMRDREGNTSEHVDLGDETNNVEIECDDDRHGEEHTGGDHEIHDEEEREVDDDTDRNMEGNSGHVVETEGEENEQAVETESEEDTEANDETDSEDSDYLVDEENNVDDVDVDMKDFDFHVDEGVEFMGCRDSEQTVDIEEGDGEEIEVLDNDYFESASDSDDEGSRLRKRKLKEIRKQAHANEQIYKTYFYVGKDFPNKEDVMAYIKEHSIETRREIRFEKNDGERVRAVCRGVIPCLPCVDEITSGANQVIGPSQGSGPSQVSGPSEGIGSKVKWTKKKLQ
ncbi:ribonuclease H-like domain-containing protein [Tanacetum coccineum]